MLASEDDADGGSAFGFDLASDIVELVVLTSDAAFLQTLREALGGAQLIACSDALAHHLDAWGASPATLPTMLALKARFHLVGRKETTTLAGFPSSHLRRIRRFGDSLELLYLAGPFSPATPILRGVRLRTTLGK